MLSLAWPDLLDIAAEALCDEAAARASEQSVFDVDSLPELPLHELLGAAFMARGIEVARERRYPIHAARRRRSEGLRCDLVLSLPGSPLEEHVWLEVKRAAHFVELVEKSGLVGRLHRAASNDVAKLASDAGIRRGALLLVVHARDRQAGEAAVQAWAHRCLDEGLPLEMPYLRHLPLMERAGNASCTLALVPVRAP